MATIQSVSQRSMTMKWELSPALQPLAETVMLAGPLTCQEHGEKNRQEPEEKSPAFREKISTCRLQFLAFLPFLIFMVSIFSV